MVHHGEYLRAITRDDLLIWHLEHDDSQAGLDPQERAMLDFARKLNDVDPIPRRRFALAERRPVAAMRQM